VSDFKQNVCGGEASTRPTMYHQIGFSPLTRALIAAAAVCVFVLFARSAASILAPTLLALFIAVIATPPLRWLRGKGIRRRCRRSCRQHSP